MKHLLALFIIFLTYEFHAAAQSEVEPNSSYALANNFQLPATISGQIFLSTNNHLGDVDYYKFHVSKAGLIRVLITQVPPSINFECTVEDSTSAGSGQSCNNYSTVAGLNLNHEVFVVPGTYYLKLNDRASNSYDSVNFYTASVFLDTSDLFEVNNSFATAKFLNGDTTFEAKIFGRDNIPACTIDIDYYYFQPTQDGVQQIILRNVPASQELHAHFFKAGSTATFCKYEPAGGAGATIPELDFSVTANNQYYFRIISYPNLSDSGTYTLETHFDTKDSAENNNTCGLARQLNLNRAYWGKIMGTNPENNCNQDRDFYKFHIPESGVFRLIFDSVPPTIKMVVREYNSNCTITSTIQATSAGVIPPLFEKMVCAGEDLIFEFYDTYSIQSNELYKFHTILDLSDRYECNQTQGFAAQIETCDTISAKLDPSGGSSADTDYYNFIGKGDSCHIYFVQSPPNVQIRYGVKDEFGADVPYSPKTASIGGVLPPSLGFAITSGKHYFPYVFSVNSAGSTSPYKFYVKDSLCKTIGIEELNFLKQIEVFPNPTKGNITIRLPERQPNPVHLTITSTQGEIVLKEALNSQESKLLLRNKPGTYILNFNLNGVQFSTPVILSNPE